MNLEPTERRAPIPPLMAKCVYSRDAQRKLQMIRSRLTSIDAKLSNALATGLLRETARLDTARRGVLQHLARAEQRLAALRKSGLDDWHSHRDSVEDAYEDLHRSIRNLVAHLSRETDEPG